MKSRIGHPRVWRVLVHVTTKTCHVLGFFVQVSRLLLMATDALRAQVVAKWQDAFNRLNRGEPGISGLVTFSHV